MNGAAVPLAGPPRAAGAPAARGSRSAWPSRRIRDGTHKSNLRAKLRSIRRRSRRRALPRPPACLLRTGGTQTFFTVRLKNQLRRNRSLNYSRVTESPRGNLEISRVFYFAGSPGLYGASASTVAPSLRILIGASRMARMARRRGARTSCAGRRRTWPLCDAAPDRPQDITFRDYMPRPIWRKSGSDKGIEFAIEFIAPPGYTASGCRPSLPSPSPSNLEPRT